MEQLSTSIVLHPGVIKAREEQRLWQEKSRQEALSPFAAFMGELERRHASRTSTQQGSVQWMSLPYEKIAVQGLWLLVESAAAKYSFDHDTEKSLMEGLLPRLDAVINNAFSLRYDSIEDAATAFEQRMQREIEDADKLTFAAERWNQPSAEFFAELVKTAETYGNRIVILVKKIRDLNSVGADRCYDYALPYNKGIDGFDEGIEMPDLFLRSNHELHQNSRALTAQERLKEAEDGLELINQLRSLPINLKGLVAQGVEFSDVRPTWIFTQAILAAGDAPLKDECLYGENYAPCLKAVASLDRDELCDLFWKRMQLRSKRIGEMPKQLREAVYDSCYLPGSGLESHIQDHTFIDLHSLPLDQIDVSAMSELIEAGMGTGSSAQTQAYFDQLDWSIYDAEKIMGFISREGDTGLYLRYASRWTEDVRIQVSDWLANNKDMLSGKEELAEISMTRIHHPFTHEVLKQIVTWVDTEYLIEHFNACLDAADDVGEDSSNHVLKQFALRASEEQVVRMASSLQRSRHLITLIELSAEMDDWDDALIKLLKRIPTELRERLFVLAEAGHADSTYEYGNLEKVRSSLPKWENRFSFPGLAKVLKLTKKRMKELLSHTSEEEAFLQLRAENPNKEELLETFRTNRAAYLAL